MRVCFVYLFICLSLAATAQNKPYSDLSDADVATASLGDLELKLQKYLAELADATEDVDRNLANEKFNWLLREVLRKEDAFTYAFDSLKMLGKITSSDNAFRLFNWNVANNDFTHTYYAYLVKKNKGGEQDVIELKDNSAETFDPETKTMNEKSWYGCLYYEIIPITKTKKPYYVLLGWDGNNKSTTKKIIESLQFSDNRVKFGLPVFNGKRRVIMEYSSTYYASLRYEKSTKRIVCDHLAPENSQMEGIYDFYGPDFTYDAYLLVGDNWKFHSNVEVKADKNRADQFYNDPNANR